MTLQKKFQAFHRKNPTIEKELTKLALLAKDRGYDQYSINGLFEILRWERSMSLSQIDASEDPLKLNNSYRSFYARLIMRKNKELKNFFRVRTQQ